MTMNSLNYSVIICVFFALSACSGGGGGGSGGGPTNSAPTATGVTITDDNGGSTVIGDSLTGSYTFADADGDTEGATVFHWLRDGTPIAGATAATYTVVLADSGSTITYEVTPIATTGTTVGSPAVSTGMVVNSIPAATNVNITPASAGVGDTLSGAYTYADADGDPEGTTTFRWLRNGTPIAGEVGTSYTLMMGDNDKSIVFEVTPVASAGSLDGSPASSSTLTVNSLDPAVDYDGDGWAQNDGDCCEGDGCTSPELINPGAAEILNNGVDDDCDVATADDVAPALCSSAAKFASVTAQDMANAMDLCQTASLADPPASAKWGVISMEFRNADGSPVGGADLGAIQNAQTAILIDYGTGGIVPQMGSTMAGMSSGMMRDAGDPSFAPPNPGTDFARAGAPPPAYVAAHAGSFPSSSSCAGTCPPGNGANDSVNLVLQIRVPTNVVGFSYSWLFASSEYWSWACSIYNDFHLSLLHTTAMGIPADKNIAFDSINNPVSVNNGLFEACVPQGCYACPLGPGILAGTGMDIANTGGSTPWLTTTAPVVPGEVITLELMIFDVSDGTFDSLVLYDNFQWLYSATGVGTGP